MAQAKQQSNTASKGGVAAASAHDDMGTFGSRVFQLVKPRLVASDLPAATREALVRIVHTAASLSANYSEAATTIRLAMNKLTDTIDWNVVCARGVFLRSKKLPLSASSLSCPALSVDVLSSLRRSSPLPSSPLPSADSDNSNAASADVDAKAKKAKEEEDQAAAAMKAVEAILAKREWAFSVVVWRAGPDELENSPENLTKLKGYDPKDYILAASTASTAAAGTKGSTTEHAAGDSVPTAAPTPADELARAVALTSALPSTTENVNPIGYTIHNILKSDVVQGRKAPFKRFEGAVADVLKVIGTLQRQIGLHADVESTFCAALQDALSRRFGRTWHVFLAEVPADAQGASKAATDGAPRPRHYPAFDVQYDITPLMVDDNSNDIKQFDAKEYAAVDKKAATELKGQGDVRYIDMSLARHFVADSASDACKSKTPLVYHLCAFRTNQHNAKQVANLNSPASTSMLSFISKTGFVHGLRYLLYLIAGLSFMMYLSLSGSGLVSQFIPGSTASSSCGRGGQALPFGPALIVLFASTFPTASIALGLHRFIPAETAAAALPWMREDEIDAELREPDFPNFDYGSLRPDCTPQRTILDELHAGQTQGLLYICAAAAIGLSIMRMVSSSVNKGKLQALVNSLGRDRQQIRQIAAEKHKQTNSKKKQ